MGVADLVQSMYVTGLMSEDFNKFKSSMARLQLVLILMAGARKLSDCHQQRQSAKSGSLVALSSGCSGR
jgi:hypothetical protein